MYVDCLRTIIRLPYRTPSHKRPYHVLDKLLSLSPSLLRVSKIGHVATSKVPNRMCLLVVSHILALFSASLGPSELWQTADEEFGGGFSRTEKKTFLCTYYLPGPAISREHSFVELVVPSTMS